MSAAEERPPDGLPVPDHSATSLAAPEQILVVEASREMREYLTRLLSPRWRVHAVAGADAALGRIAADLPDLVLGEVMVPAPDDVSLLQRLRDDPRTVGLPVLMVSSAGEEVRIEGMKAGADDCLVKPVSARELVARVAAHLELARTRTRIQQELRAARDALETELAVTARLHGFTTRLLTEAPVGRVLEDFLDAVVMLQGADAGTLLLANRRTGRFECVARQGFANDAVLDDPDAIAERRRIVVEDADSNSVAAALMPAARAAGHRAWQSTPLLSAAGDLLGVLTTYFKSPHRPTPHQLRLTDVYARVSAVIFERRWLESERHDLMQKMVTAEEAERRRISRELHDTIGQHLASLMLGLKLLRATIRGDPTAAGLVDQLHELTDLVGRQVHDLALDLRPTALDDLGLPGALAAFVSEWSRSSGVHADFHAQGWHETRFAPEAENALYRVVLEALTNVQRHANARRVGVILERRADEVLVIVEDDGTGFDVEAMSLIGSTRRLGLIGMKERASLVGGMLTIESGASGTTVFIRVPVGPRG
jgi:signal transduction histidine kinase/CheY-like chemotaxis protein